MNGCHSTLHPNRCQHKTVTHSKGNVSWPYVFSREANTSSRRMLWMPDVMGVMKRKRNNE